MKNNTRINFMLQPRKLFVYCLLQVFFYSVHGKSNSVHGKSTVWSPYYKSEKYTFYRNNENAQSPQQITNNWSTLWSIVKISNIFLTIFFVICFSPNHFVFRWRRQWNLNCHDSCFFKIYVFNFISLFLVDSISSFK